MGWEGGGDGGDARGREGSRRAKLRRAKKARCRVPAAADGLRIMVMEVKSSRVNAACLYLIDRASRLCVLRLTYVSLYLLRGCDALWRKATSVQDRPCRQAWRRPPFFLPTAFRVYLFQKYIQVHNDYPVIQRQSGIEDNGQSVRHNHNKQPRNTLPSRRPNHEPFPAIQPQQMPT